MRAEIRERIERGPHVRSSELGKRAARTRPARYLPGATRFSDDEVLSDPVQVIGLLRAFPDIHDELVQSTTVRHGDGRNRSEGVWIDAYLAFVISGIADMEKWWMKHQSSAIWQVCGFKDRQGKPWVPSFQTTYLRFVELEQFLPQLKAAATKVIRRALENEPEAGRHIFVDGAAVQAHRRLEHCCPDKAACRAAGRAARHAERVADGLLPELRAEDVSHEEPAEQTDLVSNALKPLEKGQRYDYLLDKEDGYKYQWIGGHLYRCADDTVGARHYAAKKGKQKGKFFNGWNNLDASEGYFGASIAAKIDAGDRQEFHLYIELYEEIEERLGRPPEAVSGDKALSNKAVYEHNTRKGVATVVPWREPLSGIGRRHVENDIVDRHGLPRCPDCGGPASVQGAGLGFYLSGRGTPRIRFRCELGLTEQCSGVKSVNCEKEWRLLQPLNLLDPVYHQLRHRHSNREAVHLHKRTRYTVNGQDVTTRMKRMGVDWQRLRAEASIFIEWFRICLRHGFIGSHSKRNQSQPALVRATARLKKIGLSRLKWGLELPYGMAAQRTGWGRHGPPGTDPPAHVQAELARKSK
jgi:hypothetical protein